MTAGGVLTPVHQYEREVVPLSGVGSSLVTREGRHQLPEVHRRRKLEIVRDLPPGHRVKVEHEPLELKVDEPRQPMQPHRPDGVNLLVAELAVVFVVPLEPLLREVLPERVHQTPVQGDAAIRMHRSLTATHVHATHRRADAELNLVKVSRVF